MTVAALDATLDLMLDEKRANEIPVVAGLRTTAAELEPRATRLLAEVSSVLAGRGQARIEPSEAAVGGGSLPEHRLPGFAVVIDGLNVPRVSARLREAPTPLLARVREGALWLDVRTLREVDLPRVRDALAFALEA
jgi:L-seryl-tRNA(Ser) seleniumtransferase